MRIRAPAACSPASLATLLASKKGRHHSAVKTTTMMSTTCRHWMVKPYRHWMAKPYRHWMVKPCRQSGKRWHSIVAEIERHAKHDRQSVVALLDGHMLRHGENSLACVYETHISVLRQTRLTDSMLESHDLAKASLSEPVAYVNFKKGDFKTAVSFSKHM